MGAVSRVSQIAVPAADLEAAKAFYGGALGLPHLFDAPPGMSFFDCGGVRLMLAPAAQGGAIVYYEVDEVEAVHAALAAQGVQFDSPPHFVARVDDADLWLAVCRDPHGNLVGLTTHRRG